MEPDSAAEMFNNAPQENIKFATYTGDDDSTTEAHIRQKVSYNVEKLSDIVHTKRSLTTRLYNLSQRAKFPNSSVLSQKVINYLVKCFAYGIAQNKGTKIKFKIQSEMSYHMHLENMIIATQPGVTSRMTQVNTNTNLFLTVKIYTETSWKLPYSKYLMITVPIL